MASNLCHHDFQTTLALSGVESSQQFNSIYAEFASVHKEWSAVQNKALTSVGLTFAAVRASSWFSHGGTGMCLNCMFEVLTKYVYKFQTTFPRALPLLHHDTFELLRQLQGVKGLGTAVWLSKEMALAEIQKKMTRPSSISAIPKVFLSTITCRHP